MTDDSRERVQSWTETTSARERIRSVALTLTEPRSTNWVSEQADAAWETTSDELAALADQGRLQRVDVDGSTRYQPDYTQLLFDELRTLVTDHTQADLREELATIAEEIESWQTTYDVETREALERSLATGDLASAEIRARRDVIRRWQEAEEDRRLIGHALELYDDIEAARDEMRDAAERVTG